MPTADDALEIDYEEMYKDHKCYIDLINTTWHDYSDLEEFPDLMSFLDMYRDCGFDDDHWKAEDPDCPRGERYRIKTLFNQCKGCNHSKLNPDEAQKAAEKEERKHLGWYCAPDREGIYTSCPLEEDFPKGITVTLEYKLRKDVVCSCCWKTIPKPNYDKNSLAEIPLFDVRLDGTPAKLLIKRKEEICPECRQRIAVSPEIRNIKVDLKQGMTMRLICAINNYLKSKGVSGYCKKHMAQGYGVSYSTLKKYCSAALKELIDQAEKVCLEYKEKRAKEMRAATTFFYSCSAPRYSMLLFFSEQSIKKGASELCLCAAFDKKETDTITSWARGDFSPEIPSEVSDAHLDFLADHCAEAIFPDVDHMLAFRLVQLAIAYGKFLKSGRNAAEDRETIEALVRCLQGLAFGDISFYGFERELEAIEGWSSWARKQRIFRAARRVHAVLETYLGYNASAPIRKVVCTPIPRPTEQNRQHAERIVQLVERSLRLSVQRQDASDEEPDGFYGTNSELTILRLLYINPAVTYDTTQGGYMGTPLYGVPAAEIEALLKTGLLDDRGQGRPDFLGDVDDNAFTQYTNRM